MRQINDTELEIIRLLRKNAVEIRRCSERIISSCDKRLDLANYHRSYDIGVWQADCKLKKNAGELEGLSQSFKKFCESYLSLYYEDLCK